MPPTAQVLAKGKCYTLRHARWSSALHAQVLAKEDYSVAMQLAREIEEEERQMEAQWEADRRLARQIASEERTDHKKHEKAAAQDRLLARKLSKELNAQESASTRTKLRANLGNLRTGLSELTNKMGKTTVVAKPAVVPPPLPLPLPVS